jgi:hypothetical protein
MTDYQTMKDLFTRAGIPFRETESAGANTIDLIINESENPYEPPSTVQFVFTRAGVLDHIFPWGD